jgi:protein SCO1
VSARIIVAISALVVAALATLALFGLEQHAAGDTVQLQAGAVLPQPRPLPDFALLDHHRRPFTRAALTGHWTLMFAGFTHCPDVCPATLATLASIDPRVQAAGIDLQTVLLTVDPLRDDPATLSAYVSHFSTRFLGVTGEPSQIDRLMAGLGLTYIKVPGVAGNYTVDHSTALALIDPQGRVAAYFQPPFRAEPMISDLAALARPAP